MQYKVKDAAIVPCHSALFCNGTLGDFDIAVQHKCLNFKHRYSRALKNN